MIRHKLFLLEHFRSVLEHICLENIIGPERMDHNMGLFEHFCGVLIVIHECHKKVYKNPILIYIQQFSITNVVKVYNYIYAIIDH